jgi:hypothetical protein
MRYKYIYRNKPIAEFEWGNETPYISYPVTFVGRHERKRLAEQFAVRKISDTQLILKKHWSIKELIQSIWRR